MTSVIARTSLLNFDHIGTVIGKDLLFDFSIIRGETYSAPLTVQNGPAKILERSSTRIPVSGPFSSVVAVDESRMLNEKLPKLVPGFDPIWNVVEYNRGRSRLNMARSSSQH